MASAEDHSVFAEEDEDDDESEEEEEDNELLQLHSSKSSQLLDLHPPEVEVEVADTSSSNLTASNNNQMDSTPDPKRPKIETQTIDREEKAKPAALPEESRRLFQRLWTDEDEIQLLQGFLHYSLQRGFPVGNSSSINHQDTTMFYDQIKNKFQLDFNKNQLLRKLRRMKKKYRTIESKINSGKYYSFKSPHDQATFEISRRIWYEGSEEEENQNQNPTPITLLDINNNGHEERRKRLRTVKIEEDAADKTPQIPARTSTTSVGSIALNCLPFGSLNFADFDQTSSMEDKWRKQRILELQVYSKRLDLIQDEIKSALADLTSNHHL